MRKLTIDSNWTNHHFFNKKFCELLLKSNLFDVTIAPLEENLKVASVALHPRVNRLGSLTFIKIDGKTVAINTWAKEQYLSRYLKAKLGIKIDACLVWDREEEISKELSGVPCYPLLNFPVFTELVEFCKWEEERHDALTMFSSGCHSMTNMKREKWHHFMNSMPDTINFKVKAPLEQYMQAIRRMTWGLIISIHNFKNTREYEFSSCGIPLAMNYQPRYPFPFEPGVHYVKLETPEDLLKLRDINPKPYHEASRYLWNECLCPSAMVRYLSLFLDRL